mgnify:CR=1
MSAMAFALFTSRVALGSASESDSESAPESTFESIPKAIQRRRTGVHEQRGRHPEE